MHCIHVQYVSLTVAWRKRQDVCVCCSVYVMQVFERILFIWAIRHPASGYVQGINDLVTPFFVVFLSEFVGTYCIILAPLAEPCVSSWVLCFCCVFDVLRF